MKASTEFKASPAYAVLPSSTRRVVDRILTEIETAGGKAGISHEQFYAMSGISSAVIGPAIRELVALGCIKVTVGQRRIHEFRLADEWRAVASLEEARLISARARECRPRPQPKSKPQPIVAKLATVASPEKKTDRARITLATLDWPRDPNAGA